MKRVVEIDHFITLKRSESQSIRDFSGFCHMHIEKYLEER